MPSIPPMPGMPPARARRAVASLLRHLLHHLLHHHRLHVALLTSGEFHHLHATHGERHAEADEHPPRGARGGGLGRRVGGVALGGVALVLLVLAGSARGGGHGERGYGAEVRKGGGSASRRDGRRGGRAASGRVASRSRGGEFENGQRTGTHEEERSPREEAGWQEEGWWGLRRGQPRWAARRGPWGRTSSPRGARETRARRSGRRARGEPASASGRATARGRARAPRRRRRRRRSWSPSCLLYW